MKSIDENTLRRYQKEPEMLEYLSRLHKIPKERIFLENATIGIIHRVFDRMLSENSLVLVPRLGYPYFAKVAKQNNSRVISFGFKENKTCFEYDFDDVLAKMKESPDIIVLIDPESPLGFSTSEERLIEVLRSSDPQKLVFLDQTHEGFREIGIKDIVKLANKFPNLLVARSFSKLYGLAGVRVGYAVCGANVKKIMHFEERYLGFDRLAQKVAIAALKSDAHYKKNASLARKEKKRLQEAISKIPDYKVFETDTIYSLVRVPKTHLQKLKEEFQKNKILVRWLEEYYPELKCYTRITSTPSDQTKRIIKVFEKVRRGIA